MVITTQLIMDGGKLKNKNNILIGLALVIVFAIAYAVYQSSSAQLNSNNTYSTNSSQALGTNTRVLHIVAAENFWGSLMSQLCGIHCNVTSMVTDPNADPHEYEASAYDAREISNANIVIINGVGYDEWALKLTSASNNPNRTIINVGALLSLQNGTNPHLWYNPKYVNATVKQMYGDLVLADPQNAKYYSLRYAALNASLAQVDGKMAQIKGQFAGTKIASTESVSVYLANATGLDLISPPSFMNSVSEGVDPPSQSIAVFENQLESGNVSVLIYNEQTITPLTDQMKQIAAQNNITAVGVTETIQPPNTSYQTWMNSELLNLQNALYKSELDKKRA